MSYKHLLGRPRKNNALENRAMRQRVIEARGPKCEKCGYDKEPVLEMHHIKQRKDGGSNELDNLLLLCPNCHGEIHHGIRNLYGEMAESG